MSASPLSAETAHRLALPGLILGAVLISFSGIFVKLSEVGPTATGFYRMFLALPFLFLWMMQDPGWERTGSLIPRDRGALLLTVVAGIGLASDLVAWHWCLHITTVATATLLGNTAPIWVAIGGFLFLRERFDPLFLLGLALAVLGVWGLVAGGTKPIDLRDGLAIALGLFTGVAYAVYLRAGTAARRGLTTSQVMFWGSVAATIPLLPIAALTEHQIVPHSLHGWSVLFGLALLSQVLGQSAINWAMGHLPAAFSSLTLLLNPLFAAICAWPILGEALTPLQMLAGLGVILGILLARRATNRRALRAATA
jgi:drug/metabolite transporter (DMT)-like permease